MQPDQRPATFDIIADDVAKRLRVIRRLMYGDVTTMATLTGINRVYTGYMLTGRRDVTFEMLAALRKQGITSDFVLFGNFDGMDGELAAQLHALLDTADQDDRQDLATKPGRKPRAILDAVERSGST